MTAPERIIKVLTDHGISREDVQRHIVRTLQHAGAGRPPVCDIYASQHGARTVAAMLELMADAKRSA